MSLARVRTGLVAALTLCATLVMLGAVQAQALILNNNVGTTSSVAFISGERTLVMNGFDLSSQPLQLPAVVTSATIAVDTFVPNATTDVVVYADPNGGSPRDARLVAIQQAALNNTGLFTVEFTNPVIITDPIIWIGFYLPPGFRFLADRQGASVLTYWAWSPGTTFDLANLGSATIFGPSDGSAPVNINLGGIARIVAQIAPANNVGYLQGSIPGVVTNQNFNVLANYPECPTLYKDTTDVLVSLQSTIQLNCRELESWNAPAAPAAYIRRSNARGVVYDITAYNEQGQSLTGTLPAAVTHCVAPAQEHLDVAVIGIAFGAPKVWQLLPTQRFGNVVCAEINRAGQISYFTPVGR